jgi:hypothetical protein
MGGQRDCDAWRRDAEQDRVAGEVKRSQRKFERSTQLLPVDIKAILKRHETENGVVRMRKNSGGLLPLG